MDQTIPQSGWWSRNWKWFVPVGCLSLLATCGCCFGGMFFFGYKGLEGVSKSRVYQESLERAKADPGIQAALGTPIEARGLLDGLQYNASVGSDGTVTRAAIPLKGPKGEGKLFVQAREHGQELTFQQLDFIGPDRKVIKLPGVEPGRGPATRPEEEEPGDRGDVDIDQPEVTTELGFDRPGADFRDYEMADPDSAKCALDCAGDEKCQAFTFVKPAGGKPGRCRLKARAPAKVASDCCVSGVKK